MNSFIKYQDFDDPDDKIKIRELALQHGLSFPSDAELIMLILGSGTKDAPIKELAKQVLGTVLSSNDENLLTNLMELKGMGKTKALMIAAALEFGKRINKNPQVALSSPSDIVPYIQN